MHILFVDDEPLVLEGLRNLLRKRRHVWDMVFVGSGEAALEELALRPFDVIVSDMRMPGMDGPTLLRAVKELYPSVIRIVLSGHAERDAIVRSLPVAQQFLGKPCDPEALCVVIERAHGLRTMLQETALREVVGKLDRLPTAPDTYWELTRVIVDPDVTMGRIASIIGKDPSMSVKVLQLVNSAYFGLPQHMSSVERAVGYLGIELIRGLSLTAHVFAVADGVRLEGFSLERIQRHSLLVATLAKRLVSVPMDADSAFTAGLVHDIGTVILASSMTTRFAAVLREVRETGRPVHVVEREHFGVTHAEIGAYLLHLWGLPLVVAEAVAYHHTPGLVSQGICPILAALHVSDALASYALRGGTPPELDGELDAEFIERAGFISRIPSWKNLALQVAEGARNP